MQSTIRCNSEGFGDLPLGPVPLRMWSEHWSRFSRNGVADIVPLPSPEEEYTRTAHRAFANQDPDRLLVLRVKRGDVAAFGELVERHKQLLVSYATRMLCDRAEAEDVVQNAFVRAFKTLECFRLDAHFCTWLYTIARNLCLNELRRRSRRWIRPLEEKEEEKEDRLSCLHEPQQQCRTAADALVCEELQHKIKEALSELPKPQRTAIFLLCEEELSYEQIARILDKSVAATRSLIHRGRQTLKSRLMGYLRDGD